MITTFKTKYIRTMGDTVSITEVEEIGLPPSPWIPSASHRAVETKDPSYTLDQARDNGDWEIEIIAYRNKANGTLVTSNRNGEIGVYEPRYTLKVEESGN